MGPRPLVPDMGTEPATRWPARGLRRCPPSAAPEQVLNLKAPQTAASRLSRYLQGRFDSSAQAAADPRYHAISLETCATEAPAPGDEVLYVEQAMLGRAPYRQRVYAAHEDAPAEQRALTEISSVLDADPVVGLCQRELRRVELDAVELRAGCGVFMEWDGGLLRGSTRGESCASNLDSAASATSEVTLTEDRLDSWDRGFGADGVQVWGATAGPYRFDRKSALPER